MKYSNLTAALVILIFCISLQAQTTTDGTVADNRSATSSKKKTFRPTKSQITEAQEKLKASGIYNGPADGRYNPEFRTSLDNYQESNQLSKTSKLDEPTIQKMQIALTDKQKGIVTPAKSKRVVFRVSKEQITEAQKKLQASGLYDGTADGKYSKEFRTSIREYQSANGLKRKGSLNRATLEKLEIELNEKQAAIPVNPADLASAGPKKRGPVFRSTKAQITEVQTMLRSKGLYEGENTGKLNDDTRAAIKEWQRANQVKVTGTLNKVTLEAMGITLTDKQKAM